MRRDCLDIRRVLLVWLVSSLMVALIPSGAVHTSASTQGSEPLLKNSVVFVVQGESAVVPGNETNDEFYLLRILTFDLPYDSTRVHTKVPSTAQDFFVWTSTTEVNASGYGFETSGPYAGDFYIDVPASHPRSTYATNVTDDEGEFNASGSQFVNTTYSSGSLHLLPENESGEYVSPQMPVVSAHTIESAILTYNGNSTSNITAFLSNDAGSTWKSCQNATVTDFSTIGANLKVRFMLEGNSSLGYEPAINSFSVNATYVYNITSFNVHVSCTWTQQFIDRRTLLDLSEAASFSPGGTYLLMLYLVPGYTIESSSLELVLDEDKTMSTYLDKDLYFNMTTPTGQSQSFDVTVLAPREASPAIYYVGASALVVALGVAYVLSRRSRKAHATTHEEDEEETVDAAEPFTENDEAERRELVARKKELMAEIEDVRAGAASGEVPKPEAEEKLAALKKEFKAVRNELNRLSRKSTAEPSAMPVSQVASSSKYESVLATLAKIDDDFEKGRLPESAHKSLRDEYMAKAVKLREDQESKKSPFEIEKEKLMGAIVSLDEERERGEIDEKVYTELKASYRKQLMDLIKREEEGRS